MIGGKEHIDYQEMMKCCWPAYLTVIYDLSKLGSVRVHHLDNNNDYALWLTIAEKEDCHLLKENLASMRTPYGWLGRFFMTKKLKWRYEVYRKEEDLSPLTSFFLTIRNCYYGIIKWMFYVHHGSSTDKRQFAV